MAIDGRSYLAGIRQIAQFFRHQGLDPLRTETSGRIYMLLERSTKITLPVLREFGLEGNHRDPYYESMYSIIYQGLACAMSSRRMLPTDNLISIISDGADIHDMEWANEHWVDKVDVDGVMSPTAFIKATRRDHVWRYALRKAGYNPDEVFLEDERRRREFRRLHGATSSVVAVEDPPSSTFRRRLV